ncbi:uncharacterized protein Dsimw501_GD17905 [Drosophila simulans]|uniref:Uncharacterized protein n=1 Tax=Drosophila simulans TaxID=7240 RepID=A0A0J9RJQ0_DROSI|nr:uncharacterized protein Dsimw501_GD17905 [Drosophila simulans]
MQPRIDDSSPSAAARTLTSSSSRSSWAENEGSASGSDSLLTSSTASLLSPQDNNSRLGPGPGLLIFPGTGQRHQHNPNGSPGSKTIAKANDGNVAINQPGPGRSIRSFRRPPLWQPPPEDHAQEGQEMEVLDRRDCRPACLAKGQAFTIEFLQGSSIHGFIYLAKLGLSFVERVLWLAFICVALFSIISLSKRTWHRFQTSPMVISMDRNKLVWNTSFPSLTVCPHKRIDELKVEEYILAHPDQFLSEEGSRLQYRILMSFATPVRPARQTTFGASHTQMRGVIYETQTEFGICHSVNSMVARYNSFEYWRSGDWSLMDHGDRVTVHPLDGEIYAQIINLSTAYDVYFHGAGDVPSISKQRYTFPESDYTTVELIALEIFTNEEARAFSTKQRSCRFNYEAEEMMTVPIYSFGLCLSECRMFFALRVCGCVPHFYRNRLRNGRRLPVCGLEGIGCLVKIKREIISLKSDKYKINCNCLANCDDSNFFVQSYRSRVWFLGANLQWGILEHPKMQLRREVLFSFADVLVYIGGLVGFFLGCSALSFTEIIYYFTARFVRRMFCN